MSRIYLPNASQFDEMNGHLAKIANALGSDIDISTWAGIQKAVRAGVAPNLIPVGTQLLVSHNVYGDMLYDVVAHNYFKSAHNANAYTMTLMCHDCLPVMRFDSPEAFFKVEGSTLSAGTYCFTNPMDYEVIPVGTLSFTAPVSSPVGSVLRIERDSNNGNLMVHCYQYQSDTVPLWSATATVSSSGTNLGTLGVELNHLHRVICGSNNYKESSIRQWLNSSAEAGSVWSPQTKFDRPPSWLTSTAGFMNGLDEEFIAVVGEVIVPCAANNLYESPDSTTKVGEKYTVTDKFYLASQTEIFGEKSNIIDDGSVLFPYYMGATNADRVKYQDGLATVWWLRSAYATTARIARFVHTDGRLYNDDARNSHAVVPVCTIV